jgi:ankyrin repeat protein
MKYVAENNQLDLIDYLVSILEPGDRKECVLSSGLHGACISDNYDLVEKMISLGADGNYVYYTEPSCYHNLDILRLVIERCGISDANYAINRLIRSDKIDIKIIEYLLSVENPTPQLLKNILSGGASNNNIELVELAIKYGAGDFNNAAKTASLEGHYDLLVKLISYGADNFNEIFISACKCYKCTEKGHEPIHDHDQNIKIAKLLINSYNVDNFEKAIEGTGCKFMIKFLIDNGADPKSVSVKYYTVMTDLYIDYIFYLDECIGKISMVLNDGLIQDIRSFI